MNDEYGEYIVRLENLPPSVRGFIYHDDDGRIFIVLNARLTREINRRTYEHELAHLRRGDLYNHNYLEYGEGTSA